MLRAASVLVFYSLTYKRVCIFTYQGSFYTFLILFNRPFCWLVGP